MLSVCRGVSSTVRRCLEKQTQTEYAVKMIDLTQEKDNEDLTAELRESTKKEMDVLRIGSEHPNISKNWLMIWFSDFLCTDNFILAFLYTSYFSLNLWSTSYLWPSNQSACFEAITVFWKSVTMFLFHKEALECHFIRTCRALTYRWRSVNIMEIRQDEVDLFIRIKLIANSVQLVAA